MAQSWVWAGYESKRLKNRARHVALLFVGMLFRSINGIGARLTSSAFTTLRGADIRSWIDRRPLNGQRLHRAAGALAKIFYFPDIRRK